MSRTFRVGPLTELEVKGLEAGGQKAENFAALDLVGLGLDFQPAEAHDPDDQSGDYLVVVVCRVPADLIGSQQSLVRALVLFPSVRAVLRTDSFGSAARCPACQGVAAHAEACSLAVLRR